MQQTCNIFYSVRPHCHCHSPFLLCCHCPSQTHYCSCLIWYCTINESNALCVNKICVKLHKKHNTFLIISISEKLCFKTLHKYSLCITTSAPNYRSLTPLLFGLTLTVTVRVTVIPFSFAFEIDRTREEFMGKHRANICARMAMALIESFLSCKDILHRTQSIMPYL